MLVVHAQFINIALKNPRLQNEQNTSGDSADEVTLIPIHVKIKFL
jgi:hypothetical protein